MNRNKQKFYYAFYEGKYPVEDEYGNATGEYDVLYENPIEFAANISAAKGETFTQYFGESESYDKVIVMDNDAPMINEYSVLWIDTLPIINEDGTTDTTHDYIVKKVARSLNMISIAISKVNVSE